MIQLRTYVYYLAPRSDFQGSCLSSNESLRASVRSVQEQGLASRNLSDLEEFIQNLQKICSKPNYQQEVLEQVLKKAIAEGNHLIVARVGVALYLLDDLVGGEKVKNGWDWLLQSSIVEINQSGGFMFPEVA